MMTGLKNFVRARLYDDEAYARNAFADHNDAQAEWEEPWSGAVLTGPRENEILTFDSQISRHIVRHDPARVLRDVEVMRRIVDAYEHAHCGDHAGETVWEQSRREALEYVIRLLSSRWADHPKFHESWRP